MFVKGGRAVRPIAKAFHGVIENGAVDRSRLGAHVFGKPDELKRLEAIVHPLVRVERDRFLAAHRRRRTRLVVLDVPLLFESGGHRGCDEIMVVSAPGFLQRRRALARPDMTLGKLESILARQMLDHRKRRLADVVISTGLGFADTQRRLVRYLKRRRKIRA